MKFRNFEDTARQSLRSVDPVVVDGLIGIELSIFVSSEESSHYRSMAYNHRVALPSKDLDLINDQGLSGHTVGLDDLQDQTQDQGDISC